METTALQANSALAVSSPGETINMPPVPTHHIDKGAPIPLVLSSRKKLTHWGIVINNYTADDLVTVSTFFKEKCVCGVYGLEVGESGTPHIQGYFKMQKQALLSTLKKTFATAHFDMIRSPIKAWLYCLKGEQTHAEWHDQQEKGPNYGKNYQGEQYGTPPVNKGDEGGKATKRKWADALEAAQDGRIMEADPQIVIAHYKNLKAIEADVKGQRKVKSLDWENGDSPNLWIWGDTGVGKSKFVREAFEGAYTKEPQTKWWTGYKDEEFVHIEDVLKEHSYMSSHYLRWADRYAFDPEIKGSNAGMIRPERIIFTSMYLPQEIWTDKSVLDAISRRIKVVHMIPMIDGRPHFENEPKEMQPTAFLLAKLQRQNAQYFPESQEERDEPNYSPSSPQYVENQISQDTEVIVL